MIATAAEAFHTELSIFEQDVAEATLMFYAQSALGDVARREPNVLRMLNRAPRFWNTLRAGCQAGGFIALGRVFSTGGDTHNLARRLKSG